ncbi:MAG: Clp protease ClpP, partial [Clostridiales bacterium]|nr:Clp protease ClpP [Clostridiales bacterium]
MRKTYYSMATEGRTAQINIFGNITSWPWLESDVSSYTLQRQIQDLDVDTIEVHINSYGGEVGEALAITNALMRHPAEVNTYVDGFACSAATIVFMAGKRRVMSSLSNFMVHPAWSTVSGNADELRKQANDLDRVTENSIKAYMACINRSREELVALMREERFLTPAEAVAWGFATEIDDVLVTEDKAEQDVTKKVYELLHGAQEPEPTPAPQE